MWLLIDDQRNLNVDVIARTPDAAKKMLSLECWRGVCFDHDLGTDETGYDVLNWAIENDLLPKTIQLVTSNPVGRQNMRLVLESVGYSSIDNTTFRIR